MRTLLVSLLAVGLMFSLMGCDQPSQKSGTPTKVDPGKAPPTKVAEPKAPTTPTSVPGTPTTPTKAVPPKGPSVPPVAGKAVEGKFVLRVDCGKGGSAYTDKNGVAWSPDGAYNANRKYGYVTSPGGGDTASHPMDALDPLYATERWGMANYTFDVPNGKYLVRLHFAEIYDVIAKEGTRIFTVSIQGKPALEKFDITKAAGGFGKVVVKELKADVTDGKLIIGFEKVLEFPTIQAIEVLGQ